MQINNFYWGSVEKQCIFSLYKHSFWGKKTTDNFFWQSLTFACLFRQCWNIYVGYLHWSVLFWNVLLVQKSDKTEQTLKIWLSVVIPPPPKKKLLRRVIHFSQARPWKTNKEKNEVNVSSETNLITFANMYNCFTSSGYKLLLSKSIWYQFHNFLKDVFIMVCYNSAPLYLKVILELERVKYCFKSSSVPF